MCRQQRWPTRLRRSNAPVERPQQLTECRDSVHEVLSGPLSHLPNTRTPSEWSLIASQNRRPTRLRRANAPVEQLQLLTERRNSVCEEPVLITVSQSGNPHLHQELGAEDTSACAYFDGVVDMYEQKDGRNGSRGRFLTRFIYNLVPINHLGLLPHMCLLFMST